MVLAALREAPSRLAAVLAIAAVALMTLLSSWISG
jgi:hypothetical protein